MLIGGGYICLNGLYWMMGLVEEKRFWDVDRRYIVWDVIKEDLKGVYVFLEGKDKWEKDWLEDDEIFSFMRMMWYVIREMKG